MLCIAFRRIHTGAMPYTCTQCGKKFRYKVTQRTHKCLGQKPEGENHETKKIPDLPQQIQDDLETLRKAQSRRMLHNRLNTFISRASTNELINQQAAAASNDLDAAVNSLLSSLPSSNYETTSDTSPLGQLQQLTISDGSTLTTTNQQPSAFFCPPDFNYHFERS